MLKHVATTAAQDSGQWAVGVGADPCLARVRVRMPAGGLGRWLSSSAAYR